MLSPVPHIALNLSNFILIACDKRRKFVRFAIEEVGRACILLLLRLSTLDDSLDRFLSIFPLSRAKGNKAVSF